MTFAPPRSDARCTACEACSSAIWSRLLRLPSAQPLPPRAQYLPTASAANQRPGRIDASSVCHPRAEIWKHELATLPCPQQASHQ